MFSKVLVANRGEIAVRAFRAAREIGARTVAVFPHEDRWSEHRMKAEEAYQIGEVGHPVRAYLDPQAIVDVAVRCGADAIYPGYGFLSENPALAEACAAAGITFIGPSAEVLTLTGNKARAIAAAKAAGVPVLESVPPSTDVDELLAAAESIEAPLFVKAVAGGGGRGMRRVDDRADLREAIETCMREAEGAFGDPTVFIEQAVVDPRHIEVQILSDGTGSEGGVIHLYERDCSVQRRHQKVVEIAPAPNLDPELRDRMCADAVRFAREIGYKNAGTVEFLLDPPGSYVFIEMNPRIQVEHTVTEEVTAVDLVQSQMLHRGRRDPRRPRAHPGLRAAARLRAAVPHHHRGPRQRLPPRHRQDHDLPLPRRPGRAPRRRHDLHRRRDQPALRLDARQAHLSRPHLRGGRAEGPPRAAGVPHPRRLDQRRLPPGRARRPRLRRRRRHDLVHRGPPAPAQGAGRRRPRHPLLDLPRRRHRQPAARRRAGHGVAGQQAAAGSTARSRCPTAPASCCARSARGVRPPAARARTGSPSPTPPSATPTSRCSPRACAPATCSPSPTTSPARRRSCGRSSAGAGRRTTSRCASSPRTRGSGWPPCARRSPTSACRCCCAAATPSATRPTRPRSPRPSSRRPPRPASTCSAIFDALNDVSQMRPAIDAVRATGTSVAEVALCYTGDLSSPGEQLYTLDYYLRLAEQIVDAGAHVLAIKDMAGLLRAPAARTLVTALRERFDLPVHLHTHDTPGGQLATLLAAIDAGVDAVDAACASMAGTHVAARAVRARLRDRPLRARDRPLARRGQRDGALLGGRPPRLRALRVGPARARPVGSTATRSPAASSPTCASRRSRSASARSSSRSRTCTPRPTTSSATS